MKRRKFLLGLAPLLGISALAWWKRNELIRWAVIHSKSSTVHLTPNTGQLLPVCRLTPQQTEGPFHVVHPPLRSDIREDRKGLMFDLEFQISGAEGCAPLEGAIVEIWHCDSQGRYSAYPEDIARRPFETLKLVGLRDPNAVHVEPTNGKTYLRGSQVSDENGRVKFTTIFPGWYDPRVPHIHVAVSLGNERRFASQIYFPMEFSNQIYGTHPLYVAHELCPYSHDTDPVLTEFNEADGLLVTPKIQGEWLSAKVALVTG